MPHVFTGRVSIKDMIESLGVPHPEVDLLLVNGAPVDFDYLVQDGDAVDVYPVFAADTPDVPSLVRPAPLAEAKFVLDTHLGTLARYLRLLGFDTLYRNDYPDDELAGVSSSERRILLTRDVGCLKRAIVTYGYFVRSKQPDEQIVEVLRRYALFDAVQPFSRCIRCNGLLHQVEKAAVLDLIPPETRQYYDEFRQCAGCGQVYWRGSHFSRMQGIIERALAGRED